MMTGRLLQVISVIALIQAGYGFDHHVVPRCGPEEEICVFDWVIEYTETMIYYDGGISHPVVVRNGSLYRRTSCDEYIAVNVTQDNEKVNFADGSYKLIYSINGELPGPTITVYEGQLVVINVKNNLLMDGITIHWHGMIQSGTPWMDGVGTVSQCPINPGETFQYSFLAEPDGTHWYHSHLGTQRTDGLAGAFIVLPKPRPEENNESQVKNDPEYSGDYVMILNDWKLDASVEVKLEMDWGLSSYSKGFNESECYRTTSEADGGGVGLTNFESALINGKGHHYLRNEQPFLDDIPELPYEKFHVQHNKYYRLRILNAGMLFAYRISVDHHDVQLLSTDGNDVMLVGGESIIVHTGERADIMVFADQEVANYWIRVETMEVSNSSGPVQPNFVLGILSYEGADSAEPTTSRKNCTEKETCTVINCPFKTYLPSYHITCIPIADLQATPQEIESHPVPLVQNEKDFQEVFLNFHFSSSATVPFTSAVSGHQFIPPSVPPQTFPTQPGTTTPCESLNCTDHCSCTFTVKLDLNKTTQVVIVNMDDAGGGMPHPVHMHGHHFHVLKIGYPEYDPDTGAILQQNSDIFCETPSCNRPTWADVKWKNGSVPGLNLVNPPLKDTIIVPRGGYVVLRILTDNPGFWFMHCHIEIHQINGMAVLLQEGDIEDMQDTPPNFPKCGNFRIPLEEVRKIHSKSYQNTNTKRHYIQQSHSVRPNQAGHTQVEVEEIEEVDLYRIEEHHYKREKVPASASRPEEEHRSQRTFHMKKSEMLTLLILLILSLVINMVLGVLLCCRRTRKDQTINAKKNWFANNLIKEQSALSKKPLSESKTHLVTA